MPDKIVNDGWGSLAGGMHLTGGNHNVVGEDQAEILVNATVRRGWAEPRPAFRLTPLVWEGEEAQNSFERGIIQGSGYYDSPDGARFIYVADGHIMSFDPVTSVMRIISPNGERPFHRWASFAYLQQRSHYMIAQDGTNPPVIIDGDNATINSDPYNGIPTGTMMADGWHRLAVVDPSRTKIYISDHEMDPISGPLRFTNDATYFKNAKYFEIPRSLGKVTGIAFGPSFNGQDDWGPLYAICDRGIRAYQIQYPRETWLDTDISATILPTIGGCAHDAIVVRGNDMIFSDHTGRIQTLRAALSRADDIRVKVADEPVWNLYRKELSNRRRWRKSVKFDDRIITTVWPEAVNLGNGKKIVRHQGMVVMEEEHLSNRTFVWSGLWTGICPVTIDSGGVKVNSQSSNKDQCFAVSHDGDFVNRLYEITTESGPDKMPGPKRTSMWVIPRWMNWNSIFERKRLRAAATQLSNIRGRLTMEGWWQTAGDIPRYWFKHEEITANRMMFGQGDNGLGIFDPTIKGRPKLHLPTPHTDNEFYRARPWLKLTGDARLDEGVFEAGLTSNSPGTNVKCGAAAHATSEPKGNTPNFWEPHSRDLPDEEGVDIQVCSPRELSPFCN